MAIMLKTFFKKKKRRDDDECTLVLLGTSGCGKTSFIYSFLNKEFIDDKERGAVESRFHKNPYVNEITKKTYKLDIIDTSGEFETYEGLHKAWIEEGEGFILFFNLTHRDSFLEVLRWSAVIDKYYVRTSGAPKAPKILIGTASDQKQNRKVSPEEAEDLALKLNCPFIEVSSKTFENLDLAIDTAVQYCKTKKDASFSFSDKLNKVLHQLDGTDLFKLSNESIISIKQNSSKWTSCKDIGVSSDPNKQWRSQMEDEHIFIDRFLGDDTQGFFGVYDGHGGRRAVECVKKFLHLNLAKELKSKSPITEALQNAFLITDKLVIDDCASKDDPSGSTALVAFVTYLEKRMLYVANCGDTRAVLNSNGRAIRLSKDHNAALDDQEEIKRIKDVGGFIIMKKVAGVLSVTRAFGDYELKVWVIPDPYITSRPLEATDTHLILACDGLWDVCSDQKAVDLIVGEKSASAMSNKLVEYALQNGTRDNVSVMVITL